MISEIAQNLYLIQEQFANMYAFCCYFYLYFAAKIEFLKLYFDYYLLALLLEITTVKFELFFITTFDFVDEIDYFI